MSTNLQDNVHSHTKILCSALELQQCENGLSNTFAHNFHIVKRVSLTFTAYMEVLVQCWQSSMEVP
jgi:hypothetical protein